jgi:adenylate kinase
VLQLKTEKFIKQNQSTTNKDGVKRILFEKAQQNIERRKQITALMKNALANATIYLNGTVHTVGNTTDGRNKVTLAFQDLVKLAYPKLRLLNNTVFDEQQLRIVMRSKADDLFANNDSSLAPAENEMLQYVQRRKKQDDRTTLSDLRDQFSKNSYGWPQFAIWCVAGRLFKFGKIEARQDSNVLDDGQMLEAMMNNRHHANTLIYPQADFDQAQVRKVKELYRALFNESMPHTEAKDIATQFKTKAQTEVAELKAMLSNRQQYKFLDSIVPFIEKLQELANMDYAAIITHAAAYEDALLDAKEDILDPVRKFWHGEQRKIYDKAAQFISGNQSNFEFIDGEERAVLEDTLASDAPYKGDLMKRTKQAIDELKKKMLAKIEEERKITLALIDRRIKDIEEREDFKKLDPILLR